MLHLQTLSQTQSSFLLALHCVGHGRCQSVWLHADDTQSSGFCSDEAPFALQAGVECLSADAELVLVRLRWRTHEGEVVLSPL
jgi:hypothetical protein